MTKEMDKINDFYNLLHTLRRGYQTGVHTYGACMNKCGNSARGAGLCGDCCEKEIAELTGNHRDAHLLHSIIKKEHMIICKHLDLLEGEG